ncbi:non-ribosomal peptide synthetase [Bacillus cereus]|uniref:non-ribosomal peptide synthetase n=1 Tax=Bacillus cereus TaxID=1396 RepID=UPI000BFC2A80|nr:non-ribosomal peptide synthetase [Bacillus cereus]PGV75242.1 non-ribosomal peptide synthetase [Bacillus cereus]
MVKSLDNCLPLSNAQSEIWFAQQLDVTNPIFNTGEYTEIQGEIDLLKFKEAIRQTILEVESLHVSFVETEDGICQTVNKKPKVTVDVFDLSTESSPHDKAIAWMKKDLKVPTDLKQGPLFKEAIFQIAPDKYYWYQRIHHIAVDGFSFSLISRRVAQIYSSIMKNIDYKKGKLDSFSLMIEEDIEYRSSSQYKEDKHFWEKRFVDQPEATSLSKESTKISTEFIRETQFLNSVDLDKLKESAINSGVNWADIFIAATGAYLHRITDSKEVVLGLPVMCRLGSKSLRIPGMMMNLLPLRLSIDSQMSLLDIAKQVSTKINEIKKHQRYRSEQIRRDLKLLSDNQRLYGPIINVMPFDYNLSFDGKRGITHNLSAGPIEDISINVYYRANGQDLRIDMDANPSVYRQDELKSHLQRWMKYINNVNIDFLGEPIKSIEVLSEDERNEILYQFNNTKMEYPRNRTIHQLFEEQVCRTPNQLAAVYENEKITYEELNKRANQLARRLQEKGVQPNQLIGIMVERSIEMIVGILGILKSGGAYVPIDPEYPKERIEYILKDSNVNILLTQNSLLENVQYKGSVLNLNEEENYSLNVSNLEFLGHPSDLAYVIYTSGTTGKPKGVMVEHHGLCNLKEYFKEKIKMSEEDRVLQFASLSFDAACWEILMSLLIGSSLYIPKKQTILDYQLFIKYMNENKITMALLPPTYLSQIKPSDLPSLEKLITGGSAPTLELIEKWRKYVTYINAYGPTEDSIMTTVWIGNEEFEGSTVPIGRPIANHNVYILNQNTQLQPIGIAGELCVSGEGIARGYLNLMELTEEKFIDNPFVQGEKLYRTGDLAMWLPDGNIKYLGRIDHQVKIRGYRVEIGEVESAISNIKGVQDTYVIDHTNSNGDKALCAYYVAERVFTVSEIKEYLADQLPNYMIPSYFISLEEIPVTPNGKVDRKKLPIPDENLDTGTVYVGPRNTVEQELIDVWKSVLGIKKIGILDNFYDLGGDSIKAIQVSSRSLQKGYKIEISNLLKFPTISQLSNYVEPVTNIAEQGEVKGIVPLTPIQSWFFETEFVNQYFNQAMMLYQTERFNIEILKKVMTHLVKHHDVLRTKFNKKEDNVEAEIYGMEADELFSLEVFNLEGVQKPSSIIESKANIIQSSIHIEKGPLVKLGLFQCDDGDHLLIVIHHLVIDLVSWRILLEDIRTAYDQGLNGRDIELPNKTDSFKLWAEKLVEYANSPVLEQERMYWDNIEHSQTEKVPVDYEENNILNDSNDVFTIEIDKEETEKLIKQSNRAYHTEINDLLLTALGEAVHNWSGMTKILVNLEGHGREDILKGVDVTRTVGWFTSQFPVLLTVESKTGIADRIKTIKECIREIPNKGIGYGILRYLSKNKRETSNYLNPEISFNYFGQMDQDFENNAFRMSSYCTGKTMDEKTKRLYKLNIHGVVQNEKLIFEIDYSKANYQRDTIEKLGEYFKKSLKAIIQHCVCKKESEITPSDLTLKGLSLKELEKIICNTKHIGEIENIYNLTPMQKGMLFHSLIDDDNGSYFEQMAFDLKGELQVGAFRKSIEMLVKRHEILRTNVYPFRNNEYVQIVYKDKKVHCDYKDIRNENQDAYIKSYMDFNKSNGFNLEEDTLLKIAIFKIDEQKHRVIFSFPHIIMDGWCMPLILKEWLEHYDMIIGNKTINPTMVTPYSRYIDWLNKRDVDAASNYWQSYLADYEDQTFIPNEKIQTGSDFYNKDMVVCNLSEDVTKKLQELAIRSRVTLNTVMQTIWGVLLQKYNNTQDVVFGSVVSGRPEEIPGIETMIGLFINTIPIRVRNEKDMNFMELMKSVQKSAIESKLYDTYPLYEIQLKTEQKQGLIHHIMLFENYPVKQKSNQAADGSNKISIENFQGEEQTNYNFNIKVIPGRELRIQFDYNTNAYERSSIQCIGNHLITLINQIIEKPEVSIGMLNIITEEEKTQILKVFNDTKMDYPNDKTIHELFEEQVELTPEQIALVFGEQKLTYKQLNERANQLARTLRAKGVTENQLVAIMTDRSIEMIVGILGILKSGGVYVPIDPDYPEDRKKFLLQDSGTKLLLIQQHLKNSISFKGQVLDLSQEESYDENVNNLESIVGPNSLAYVIYTSGTTGKPKGVMLEHHGLCNLQLYFKNTLQMNESDRVAQFANLSFDASLWEIFSAFFSGATLYIPNKSEVLDYALFEQFIIKHGITALSLTPAYAIYLDPKKLPTLEKVVTSGSSSSGELVNKWKKHVLYINGYGPTENTICTSTWLSTEGYNNKLIPIGKPIQNHNMYIVDANTNLQPIGVAGEICLSGVGLAKGYLNREDLTSEKFIDNPFISGERMYRTGDLARWLPDGNIEFLGRIDHQVKIRGYRIEIGELEEVLLNIKSMQEVIVVPHEDETGNKALCAYYVATQSYSVSEIRKILSKELPNYMMPSYFVQLSEMPLTTNGKIDRKALPKPDTMQLGEGYVSPRTPVEIQLAEIWGEVLGLQRVGVNDNFFDLGGHSLKLLQLIQCINEKMNGTITYKEVIQSPTIELLALQLMKQGTKPKDEVEFIPLSNKGKFNVFCFPTGFGLGMTFIEMARLLEQDFNVYVTDFMDCCANYNKMLDEYVEGILKIQEEGPYILLGYCAGGNLAFEVAKVMESKGKHISDIIMLDTTIRNKEVNEMFENKASYLELEHTNIPEWATTPYAQNKYNKFRKYLGQLDNKNMVQANIHNLTVDTITNLYKKEWANHTVKEYVEYEGIGTHDELLDPEFIDYNVEIINRVLTQITMAKVLN